MSIIIAVLIVQMIFAVHAVKTGKDKRWLFFIILVPGLGCLVYFLTLVLPDLFRSATVAAYRVSKGITDMVDPDRDMRRYTENLDISDNINNTINLARECINKDRLKDAIELLENSRTGIFKYDPKLLPVLAQAYFSDEKYEECKQVLDELIAENPDFKWMDGHLMYARCLANIGEIDQALKEYETLVIYYIGPEAKYRYGKLLMKIGQKNGALEVFEGILRIAKRAPRHYRSLHKEWINKTKAQLSASQCESVR